MLEHWTYNYENRVFSTPIINLSEATAHSASSSTSSTTASRSH